MSCVNCSHTMACVGENGGYSVFQCERCGTVKVRDDIYTPKLVLACREYEKGLAEVFRSKWKELGIAESINVPSERDQPQVKQTKGS